VTEAFLTGLALGFSLIIAIGAQNAFVLRQGLLGQHVFSVALFCATSDAVLIFIGINGASFIVEQFVREYATWLFWGGALWLFFYGCRRFWGAYRGQSLELGVKQKLAKLPTTLLTASFLTFANPHVYLDTVVLIGTVSITFDLETRLTFGIGAAVASFVFFFTLAYSAKMLSSKVKTIKFWRLLDLFIGLIMFVIAIAMVQAGNNF